MTTKRYEEIIMWYRQCKLCKYTSTKSHKLSRVAFIPDEFTIINRRIKIKEDGVWNVGWVVTEVSSTKTPENCLPDSHKEIKAHRKHTGDNTPKVKSNEQ